MPKLSPLEHWKESKQATLKLREKWERVETCRLGVYDVSLRPKRANQITNQFLALELLTGTRPVPTTATLWRKEWEGQLPNQSVLALKELQSQFDDSDQKLEDLLTRASAVVSRKELHNLAEDYADWRENRSALHSRASQEFADMRRRNPNINIKILPPAHLLTLERNSISGSPELIYPGPLMDRCLKIADSESVDELPPISKQERELFTFYLTAMAGAKIDAYDESNMVPPSDPLTPRVRECQKCFTEALRTIFRVDSVAISEDGRVTVNDQLVDSTMAQKTLIALACLTEGNVPGNFWLEDFGNLCFGKGSDVSRYYGNYQKAVKDVCKNLYISSDPGQKEISGVIFEVDPMNFPKLRRFLEKLKKPYKSQSR